MKKRAVKRLIGLFSGAMLLSMFSGMVYAHADGKAEIVESYVEEDAITVYVKGTEGEISEEKAYIGSGEADKVTSAPVDSIKTLVMIDNSISIPQEDRNKTAEFLQNLISDRTDNEQIAISTFSEDVQYISEYTNDYSTLKKAIDSIVYNDQETYLSDVLYELLENEFIYTDDTSYKRIVIVSDGVDNKSLGITKEELYELLRKSPYPIYTIGCVTKNNNDNLENMFALSRMTHADYFVLSQTEQLLDITDALSKDREITAFRISTPADAKDGGSKAVKIDFTDGEGAKSVQTELRMKQELREEPEPTKEPPTPAPTETPEEKPAPAPEIIIQEKEADLTPVFLVIGGILLLGIITAVILIVRSKKKKENEFEQYDPSKDEAVCIYGPAPDDNPTEYLGPVSEDGDDKTHLLWGNGNGNRMTMILTDVNSPAKTFSIPLDRRVTVGRTAGKCDLVIDYDRSVSKSHCEIFSQGGRFYVRDLQSSNGTFLNGNQVLTETEIMPGCVLRLGRLDLRFEVR